MKDQIIEAVTQQLRSHGCSVSKIKTDDLLFENGILDSFGMVEMIGFLENKYNVRFNEDDLVKENLESLDKIAELVLQKKKPS